MKAVFLDRDGVINKALVRDGKPYPPQTPADFVILEGVPEACRLLKRLGYLLIVATNQPDVGRGTLRREIVEEIHASLARELNLDRIEVCYDAGGLEPSACRKPAPGMLLNAARLLNVALKESWMIGDRWRDIDCGAAAGCRTIFIDHGYSEQLRCRPDYRVSSLLEAAHLIEGVRC